MNIISRQLIAKLITAIQITTNLHLLIDSSNKSKSICESWQDLNNILREKLVNLKQQNRE